MTHQELNEMSAEERAWWTPERIAEYNEYDYEQQRQEFPRGEFPPQANVGPCY